MYSEDPIRYSKVVFFSHFSDFILYMKLLDMQLLAIEVCVCNYIGIFSYQIAPLDFGREEFYLCRKSLIDSRLEWIRTSNIEVSLI